jgi:RimJ/RimL family protein N-acetyltransferase
VFDRRHGLESALTAPHDGLTLRPITGPEELELFCRLPYLLNEELADDLAAGRRRPDWMWVALRDDELLARVAWWARADADTPLYLDILDIDDRAPLPEVGLALVQAALAAVSPNSRPAEYLRYVPADWRESTVDRPVVEDRMTILEQAGAKLFVERIRLGWLPGTPIAAPSGRLEFRPADNTDELLALMESVLTGTLDAHSRHDLTSLTPREATVKHYESELALYESPREWWQIATLPGGGEPVGFVIPARNTYNPIIAYLGVAPAHRGRGYIDDILAEGTRILAGQDVPRIRASTDVGNVPMAKAFYRNGYDNLGGVINMTWS